MVFEVHTHDEKHKIFGEKRMLNIRENEATSWHLRGDDNKIVSCRLGEAMPPFVIVLRDNNNNIVAAPLKGSVKLEIIECNETCIRLTGASSPQLVALTPTNNGLGLRTPSDKWIIEPRSPHEEIFPPQTRDLQFRCILHFDCATTNAASASRVRKIEAMIAVKLYPGSPVSFHLELFPASGPAQLDLKFNEIIPPIKLWCIDRYANRTMPLLPSEINKWRLVLLPPDEDANHFPLKFETKQASSVFIAAQGGITLNNLESPFGTGSSSRKVCTTLIGLQVDGKNMPDFKPRTLIVNFTPDEYPTALELYDGVELMCNEREIVAGQILNDLNVRIMSNKGNVWPFPKSAPVLCHFGMGTIRNSKKRKQADFSDDGSIKSLQVSFIIFLLYLLLF